MSDSHHIFNKRLVLFSGKGGVGKTTLAAAFAYSCARRGQRTLLIELNVKDRLSSLFGSAKIGSEIREIEENLYGVNITPEAAMKEFGLMQLKIKFIYKAVFENRIVSAFLKVIPGLNELVMLGKVHHHATETKRDGKFVWDKVVVDAPATGHGIFFLQIPSVITSLIDSGPMFNDAKKIQDFLTNPELCALNLVTLPEEMPVNETLMLKDVVNNKLKMPIGFVAANCVYEQVFDTQACAWLDQLAAHDQDCHKDIKTDDDDTMQGFLNAAWFRKNRAEMQEIYLNKLHKKMDLPVVSIPYYFTERFDFKTISKIADNLDAQLKA